MAQWPSYVQVNIFAFDNYFYGDTDGDGVIERLPPNTVAPNYLNMSIPPQPVSHTLYFHRPDIRFSIWHGLSRLTMQPGDGPSNREDIP
jgi:hypothetical protein